MKIKFNWRELIVFISTGFFIGFLISALVAPGGDICGFGESLSSPLIFISIATVLLAVFYFVSNLIKKDLYFILLIIVFAVLFEYFVAQPYIVKSDLDLVGIFVAMPIVHLLIFYMPRVLIRKVL